MRLKQLVNMAGDYEKKIRGIEIKLEYGIAYVRVMPLRWVDLTLRFHSNLNRELDSKKRLLDNVENSVAKMTAAKQEWRAKLLAKEEELAQAKASRIHASANIPSDPFLCSARRLDSGRSLRNLHRSRPPILSNPRASFVRCRSRHHRGTNA